MRYPDDHKERVRERIVEVTATALRKEGIAGVSIPRVMKAAGLTHGGFYNHFADRDELIREALEFAAASTKAVGDPSRGLDEVLQTYLSPGHAAHPDMGCVLAALGSEAPRQSPTVKRVLSDTVSGFVRGLHQKLAPGAAVASKPSVPSDEALVLAAQMVGAVILSRMVRDRSLSQRILDATRAAAGRAASPAMAEAPAKRARRGRKPSLS